MCQFPTFFHSNIPNYNNEEDALSSVNRNITINRKPIGTRPLRLRRTQTAHNLNVSMKLKRSQDNSFNTSISEENKQSKFGVDSKQGFISSKESPLHSSLSRPITINNSKGNTTTNGGGALNSSSLSKTNGCNSIDLKDSNIISGGKFKPVTDNEKSNLNNSCGGASNVLTKQPPQLQHSLSTISNETLIVGSRKIGRRASTISKTEFRQREAMWDLFQSENAFLIDHLMVIKHVRAIYVKRSSSTMCNLIFFRKDLF